ncbi:MAG: glycosyltransferase [Xanthomonadales bacterium]|nr:glycosyltransferase [Xanthomonadales bacterium]
MTTADAFAQAMRALPPLPARAIIINCSTRVFTTLALMSALRHAGMPVLVIDCASTDDSLSWLRGLQRAHTFDLLEAPLRPHGATLDRIFLASRDESLLLVDSDLELRNGDLVPELRAAASADECYGGGFLHSDPTCSIGPATARERGRYADRMWIPLVWMKTAPVRQALQQGHSFLHARDYFEFPWSRALSRWIYQRYRLPLLRRISLASLRDARQRLHGERAAFVDFDTGARMHAALQAQGLRLADLGEPHWSQSVHHYHGITRATLQAGKPNATDPRDPRAEVDSRLRTLYGIDPPGDA